MKRVNDIGGEDGAAKWGPIPMEDKQAPYYGKLATALRAALGNKGPGLVNLHESRRAREDVGDENYHALRYFDLATVSVRNILIEKGVLTADEIEERIEKLRGS